jgi:hypothetical protein
MDKQIQIILRNLAEIIYEQIIKDFKNGKLKKLEPVKVVGKSNKKN